MTEKISPRDIHFPSQMPASPKYTSLAKHQSASSLIERAGDSDTEVRDPEEIKIDREVEEFRLLLEEISAESALRSRKKLVLPPGSFAHLNSMTVS